MLRTDEMRRILTLLLESGGNRDETTIWIHDFQCNGKAWSAVREDLLADGLMESSRGRASITEAGRAFCHECAAQASVIADAKAWRTLQDQDIRAFLP